MRKSSQPYWFQQIGFVREHYVHFLNSDFHQPLLTCRVVATSLRQLVNSIRLCILGFSSLGAVVFPFMFVQQVSCSSHLHPKIIFVPIIDIYFTKYPKSLTVFCMEHLLFSFFYLFELFSIRNAKPSNLHNLLIEYFPMHAHILSNLNTNFFR